MAGDARCKQVSFLNYPSQANLRLAAERLLGFAHADRYAIWRVSLTAKDFENVDGTSGGRLDRYFRPSVSPGRADSRTEQQAEEKGENRVISRDIGLKLPQDRLLY